MKKLSWLLILPVLVIASCGGQKSTPSSSVAPQESSSLSSSEEQSSSSVEDKSSSALPSSSSAAPSSSSEDRASSSSAKPSSSSEQKASSSSALPSSSVAPTPSSSSAASSSNSSSSSQQSIPQDVEIGVTIEGNDVKIIYNDSFFNQPSSSFDHDLAMFAYGASICTGNKASIMSFYSQATFANPFTSASYNVKPTDDSIAYAFASKTTNNGPVVIATVRGFNYEREWASNLDLGKTGNHHGFELSALSFIEDFDAYIRNNNLGSAKVLVTGYSRGGAVANVAADLLFKREATQKLIPDCNFYVYTFEAPRGLTEATQYSNVYNVINSADIITCFAPAQYELYRCGIDIDIYSADVDNIVKDLNESIVLPAFTSNSDYANEAEFNAYLLTNLTKDYFAERNINTRELFVDNAQPIAQYFMKMFFSLKATTVAQLKEDLSKKEMMDLLGIIISGQNMHDFLKPYLDDDGYTYDDDELLSECNNLTEFLTSGPGTSLLSQFISQANKDNLMRVIQMHYPHINYALLNAYSPAIVMEE